MIRSVIAHAASYWAGEYAIAFRYFTDYPRTPESDLRWVRFQMVKEWGGGGVYGKDVTLYSLIQRIARAMEGIESSGVFDEAMEVARLLHFTAEEFRHYALLCEAHRLLAPQGGVSMAEMNHLANGDRLKQVRNAVREAPLGDLVVRLSEGGGLALFFAIVDAYSVVGVQSELDAVVERFARGTLEDEKQHLGQRFRAIQEAGLSDADWDRVDSGLQKISAERLRERNRQFGGLFLERELDDMGCDLRAGHEYVSSHLGFLEDLVETPRS